MLTQNRVTWGYKRTTVPRVPGCLGCQGCQCRCRVPVPRVLGCAFGGQPMRRGVLFIAVALVAASTLAPAPLAPAPAPPGTVGTPGTLGTQSVPPSSGPTTAGTRPRRSTRRSIRSTRTRRQAEDRLAMGIARQRDCRRQSHVAAGDVSRHAADGERRALHRDLARADRGDQPGDGRSRSGCSTPATGRRAGPATSGSCIAAFRTGPSPRLRSGQAPRRSGCCWARSDAYLISIDAKTGALDTSVRRKVAAST